MNDNTSLEVAISIRSSSVPNVHPHPRSLTIRRSQKVGIVVTASVLSITDDRVATLATEPEVVSLEVTGDLIETETVEKIVVHIRRVEELSDNHVDILLRSEAFRLPIVVHKNVRVIDRSGVEQEVIAAFPVFVSISVVTNGSIENGVVVIRSLTRNSDVPGVSGGRERVPPKRRGNCVPRLCHHRQVAGNRVIDT